MTAVSPVTVWNDFFLKMRHFNANVCIDTH